MSFSSLGMVSLYSTRANARFLAYEGQAQHKEREHTTRHDTTTKRKHTYMTTWPVMRESTSLYIPKPRLRDHGHRVSRVRLFPPCLPSLVKESG